MCIHIAAIGLTNAVLVNNVDGSVLESRCFAPAVCSHIVVPSPMRDFLYFCVLFGAETHNERVYAIKECMCPAKHPCGRFRQ